MKIKHILKLILEATPHDKWVWAKEIAEKTGLNTQTVGSMIGYNLLQYIERKRFKDSGKTYLYKRISALK